MDNPNSTTLTAQRAQELLRYEPGTGKLFWRITTNSRARAGTEAGFFSGHGYRKVRIGGREYYTHRLIWLIVTGAWPTDQLDHINGDGLDNRRSNLREVTGIENNRNAKRYAHNTSGTMGVCWSKNRRKWVARIKVNGTTFHLGCFGNLPDAVEARKSAELRYGFHENHGREAMVSNGTITNSDLEAGWP